MQVQGSVATATAETANWQSISCYSSGSESYASQELDAVVQTNSSSKSFEVVNPNGKSKSSRGAATDPQSLYARVENFIIHSITLNLLTVV